MKKNIIIYIAIFVGSMLITNGLLFFVFKKDSAAAELVRKAKLKADSLKAYTVKDTMSINEDPLEEVYKMMDLRKKVSSYNEEPKDYLTKSDSMLVSVSGSLDKILALQQKNMKKIIDLNEELKTKDAAISENNKKMGELQQRVTQLQEELKKKQEEIRLAKADASVAKKNAQSETEANSADAQQNEKNLKFLANTLNGMDPGKVAILLESMPDKKAAQILKRMNQRKIAKVLSALPAERAAILAQYLE